MRKIDNKGLSLIELLVAIAVMALLLSPIMLQLIQSVNLSGQAKERQYVIDSANETIEYIRKYDKSDLGAADNEGVVKVTGVSTGDGVDCELYKSDGTYVGKVEGDKWSYTKYTLEPTNLGKKSQSYSRYAVQSDLIYAISAMGYTIDYDETVGSSILSTSLTGGSSSGSTFQDAGFTIRSDNTIVKTSGTDVYDDSTIVAYVVKEKSAGSSYDYINPNETSIGDIQDIDADKMAIISGDATTLDYQVEADMKTALIQYAAYDAANGSTTFLSKPPYDDPTALNEYIVTMLSSPANVDKRRNIHITVTAGQDSSGPILKADGTPKYYHVRCDVIYKAEFNSSAGSLNGLKLYPGTDSEGNYGPYNSSVGIFSYTVLDRKYYTDVPPNIYMIYEPLITQTATGTGSEVNISYAEHDYITVSTDKYTSGDDTVPNSIKNHPSKLYLIRSTDNWQKIAEKTVPGTDDGTSAYYTTAIGGGRKLVDIHITQGTVGAANTDGFYIDDKQHPIDIYTNIALNKDHKEYMNLYGTKGQFTTGHVAYSPGFKTSGITGKSYTSGSYTEGKAKVNEADASETIYDYEYIHSVYNEAASPDGRLFKVTVVYTNDNTNEETYITGAKGAN